MILALQVVALISMLTIIFIAVWSFIIANKAYSQMRYQNYLLEKLIHNVTLLKNNTNCDEDINLSSTEYSKTHNNQSTAKSSKDSEVVDHETSFESKKFTSTNV